MKINFETIDRRPIRFGDLRAGDVFVTEAAIANNVPVVSIWMKVNLETDAGDDTNVAINLHDGEANDFMDYAAVFKLEQAAVVINNAEIDALRAGKM
jgi:hypothetical protein